MMDVLQSYNAQDDDGGAAPQLRWRAIHADAQYTEKEQALPSHHLHCKFQKILHSLAKSITEFIDGAYQLVTCA